LSLPLHLLAPPPHPSPTHRSSDLRLRRRAARPRARWAGAAARPASLLLEEREMGARDRAPRRGRARLLGGVRLPQLRRPVARTADRKSTRLNSSHQISSYAVFVVK